MHVQASPSAALLLFLTLPVQGACAQDEGSQERISSFGRYEGWSEERFEEWTTTSLYVEMRDGVKLAVDITRPAVDGVAVEEPLPLVWTHSRYHRNPAALARLFSGGREVPPIRSNVDAQPALQRLVRHGYVVCAAGVRGSGASYGRFEGLFSEAETEDAVELIAWFAEQPFCDGNVGMYGGSYLGITQYMAASHAPPALKAICPDVAAFDMFELLYPGGVFREDMIRHWDQLTDQLDLDWPAPVVDGDEDGTLRDAAIAEHADNWQVLDGYRSVPTRDGSAPGITWLEHGPGPRLAAVNEALVPTYHFNGWFDVFAHDTCQWFVNYTGPQRMLMGDWSHAQMTQDRARLCAIEQHRWFDRWLKGIENGVDEEAPIQYALVVEPGRSEWLPAESWPPAGARDLEFWFVEGPTGSVESSNDGQLSQEPMEGSLAVTYEVDPSTTTGPASRWDNAVGATPGGMAYDLGPNDERSLTWTTPPLDEDLTLVGHPVVTLHVTASRGDADFFVVLEEVDEAGDVRYVTEGVVRGSFRATSTPPFDNLGLPWQRCFAEDATPLPTEEPARIELDLHPTAHVIDAGHRLRVAVFCADRDNTEAATIEMPATVQVFQGGATGSGIRIPTLP